MSKREWLRRILCGLLCCTLALGCGIGMGEEANGNVEEENRILTLSLVGDCCIGDQAQLYGYKSGYVYKIGQAGLDYPFSLVAEMFSADDLTLANCECSFTQRRKSKKAKMAMVSDPEYAQVLKYGNVDVCSLANNHTKDFGKQGLEDTQAALDALGIGSFCEERTWTAEIKGVKIGIVGYQAFPMNDQKLKKYVEALEALRAEGCTFVIASCHWGTELGYRLDANQKYATRMIDAGFDMVYGHGSHTCQMVRWYKGKVIFYSLGNFTYGANANQKDSDSVVAQIRYDIQPDGSLTARDLVCLPFSQHQDKDYRPCPIPEEDTEGRMRVWAKMYYNHDKKNWQKHLSSPAPSLPESFLKTGYVDFTALPVVEE